MDNLDRLVDLFDSFTEKALEKSDPWVDKTENFLEKGLNKVIGAGFKLAERIKEKKNDKAAPNNP